MRDQVNLECLKKLKIEPEAKEGARVEFQSNPNLFNVRRERNTTSASLCL